ncbi:hypothetical protein [Streptomyces chryseus]|uniref:hypothetical protein n=2 Tax=Streptomyces chryseus TaxID=68186 RepID=UPI001ABF8CDD|nr:hypothetical protein [Streptomyces chryseus]
MANQAMPQQIRDLKRAQRREADSLRTQLKKAEKNRRIRYAATAEPQPPTPLVALPEDQALQHLRDLDAFDLRTEALPDFIALPPAEDLTCPIDTAPHEPDRRTDSDQDPT